MPDESYSKPEIDLRFEQMLGEVRQGFFQMKQSLTEMESRFSARFVETDSKIDLVEKDISWIKTFLTTAMISLLITLVGIVLPIAWTLWSNIVNFR